MVAGRQSADGLSVPGRDRRCRGDRRADRARSRHVLEIAGHRQNWSRMVDAWPSIALQLDFLIYIALPALGVLGGMAMRLSRSGFRWRSLAASWTIGWVSLPLLIALLSTWSGFAALAMLRYLVVSLAGAIVFAALCHASFASRAYRAILGTVIVVFAIASSGMVEQWRYDGRWIGDRNEPWNELVVWLNERWSVERLPVLLCPGLLEDPALAEDADPRLQEYCRFPLQSLYRLEASPLIAVATPRPTRLPPRVSQLVSERGGTWLVIRAREEAADLLIDALSGRLAMCPVEKRRFGNLVVVRLVRAVRSG